MCLQFRLTISILENLLNRFEYFTRRVRIGYTDSIKNYSPRRNAFFIIKHQLITQ